VVKCKNITLIILSLILHNYCLKCAIELLMLSCFLTGYRLDSWGSVPCMGMDVYFTTMPAGCVIHAASHLEVTDGYCCMDKIMATQC
jgi:hypothetical protein